MNRLRNQSVLFPTSPLRAAPDGPILNATVGIPPKRWQQERADTYSPVLPNRRCIAARPRVATFQMYYLAGTVHPYQSETVVVAPHWVPILPKREAEAVKVRNDYCHTGLLYGFLAGSPSVLPELLIFLAFGMA